MEDEDDMDVDSEGLSSEQKADFFYKLDFAFTIASEANSTNLKRKYGYVVTLESLNLSHMF